MMGGHDRRDLALKHYLFTGPKGRHLAKNKLYGMKLENYSCLNNKSGMIWMIGSSVIKFL